MMAIATSDDGDVVMAVSEEVVGFQLGDRVGFV